MTAARKVMTDWTTLISDEIDSGLIVTEASALASATSASQPELLVGQGMSPEDLLQFALDKGFGHLLQSDSAQFETDLKASALMALNPGRLKDFPVSAILAPKACGPEQEKNLTLFAQEFCLAKEKSEILRKIEEVLAAKIKSTGLRADIVTVSDELLTNAIFNAPFVDLANTTPGESRENPSVRMTDGKFGQFFIGADSERLVVGCRDPYGSLNPKKLLERIRNCYLRSVAATMNMDGKGGAGIGSFMIFNASISYYLAVEKLKTTVVCAVLPLTGSGRQRQEAPKSLHILNLEES